MILVLTFVAKHIQNDPLKAHLRKLRSSSTTAPSELSGSDLLGENSGTQADISIHKLVHFHLWSGSLVKPIAASNGSEPTHPTAILTLPSQRPYQDAIANSLEAKATASPGLHVQGEIVSETVAIAHRDSEGEQETLIATESCQGIRVPSTMELSRGSFFAIYLYYANSAVS